MLNSCAIKTCCSNKPTFPLFFLVLNLNSGGSTVTRKTGERMKKLRFVLTRSATSSVIPVQGATEHLCLSVTNLSPTLTHFRFSSFPCIKTYMCDFATFSLWPSQCAVSCGHGYQMRAVRCVSGAYGNTVDDRECNAALRPRDSQVGQFTRVLFSATLFIPVSC